MAIVETSLLLKECLKIILLRAVTVNQKTLRPR